MTKEELNKYDFIIVAFSGGKDSLACVLHLLDLEIPRYKIELWHHLVDGNTREEVFMDWPVTLDYCYKVAKALNLRIYFSWKDGGFKREMFRQNQPTAPNFFEHPGNNIPEVHGIRPPDYPMERGDNIIECGLSGGNGPLGTRMKFPQISPDLRVRWCSAYLKIDVCTASINNQPRFRNSKTLVISGERAEESSARAKYKSFEPDRSDNRFGKSKRHVDRWRPVHGWKEKEVWEIIEKHRINPHPAYRLGWGRLSCMYCIFGNDNQWASAREVDRSRFSEIEFYESMFGTTIRRNERIGDYADNGIPYLSMTDELKIASQKEVFDEPVILDKWTLPAGAYGESNGPE